MISGLTSITVQNILSQKKNNKIQAVIPHIVVAAKHFYSQKLLA